MFSTFIYLFAVLFCATNASLVPFIDKCKVDDPKCILESTKKAIPIFAAGLPELGVDVLDPAYLKRIDASTGNLKVILTDVYVKGMKGCVPNKVEFRDIKDTPRRLYLKVVCSIELDGDYDMKGQLLVPIEGHGKTNAVLTDTVYKVDCELFEKTKNGKLHLSVKSCTNKHEFKPNSKVHFDNLFPQNEVLSRTAREVLESNADLVVAELGPPINRSFLNMITKNIKNLIENVPVEDLLIL